MPLVGNGCGAVDVNHLSQTGCERAAFLGGAADLQGAGGRGIATHRKTERGRCNVLVAGQVSYSTRLDLQPVRAAQGQVCTWIQSHRGPVEGKLCAVGVKGLDNRAIGADQDDVARARLDGLAEENGDVRARVHAVVVGRGRRADDCGWREVHCQRARISIGLGADVACGVDLSDLDRRGCIEALGQRELGARSVLPGLAGIEGVLPEAPGFEVVDSEDRFMRDGRACRGDFGVSDIDVVLRDVLKARKVDRWKACDVIYKRHARKHFAENGVAR